MGYFRIHVEWVLLTLSKHIQGTVSFRWGVKNVLISFICSASCQTPRFPESGNMRDSHTLRRLNTVVLVLDPNSQCAQTIYLLDNFSSRLLLKHLLCASYSPLRNNRLPQCPSLGSALAGKQQAWANSISGQGGPVFNQEIKLFFFNYIEIMVLNWKMM